MSPVAPTSRPGGLRQAMAGLHTWLGLGAGWVLYVVFFTGSLTVFRDEITAWMSPGLAVAQAPPLDAPARARAAWLAQRHLVAVAPSGHFWSVQLPDARDPSLRLAWEGGHGAQGSARLDPRSGDPWPQPVGDSLGGRHFQRMHHELQAGMAGLWVVAFFSVAMLVALVSGVILHRRIFRDFFTFRAGKGPRSWLDAHNALGVLTLPFQLVITYTGIAVFYATFLPAGIAVHFGSHAAYAQALDPRPAHRAETGIAAPVAPLDGLLVQAEARLGRPVVLLTVEHPGDSSAVADAWGPFDESRQARRLAYTPGGRVLMDAVDGRVMHVAAARSEPGGAGLALQRAMEGLHFATFGGTAVRVLYLLLGAAGTMMIATGALLFTAKRRQRALEEFGIHTARVYRGVERLNVAVFAGLPLACVAYLWASRLLPASLHGRADVEGRMFFAALSVIW